MLLWAHGVPRLLAACSRQGCQLGAALLEECAEGDGRRRQAQELVEQLRPALALGGIQGAHKQELATYTLVLLQPPATAVAARRILATCGCKSVFGVATWQAAVPPSQTLGPAQPSVASVLRVLAQL